MYLYIIIPGVKLEGSVETTGTIGGCLCPLLVTRAYMQKHIVYS